MNEDEKKSALKGIRILDLTRVLAGPFCTMLLADMGAEVIKIEVPGKGDDARSFPPFIEKESAYFMNLNRNKKGITLNLKNNAGKEIFFELIKKSDVIVENFRPGTMEKMGIGYNKIKEINPDIIYASISGFGHTGPYKERPGYDIIGQAMGGIMSVTGWPDSPPTKTGTAIADVLGGLYTCIGILGGLLARNSGYSGQQIDISLVDAVVASMETLLQIYLIENRVPKREGNKYEFIYPYDSFEAKDGWVVIAVGNDKLWRGFCNAIGRTDLLEEVKYSHNVDRVRYHKEIKTIVENWTRHRDSKEIEKIFLSHQIPCAPIFSLKDIVSDEHIAKAREMILEIDHPSVGKMKLIGSPIKMSVTQPAVSSPAPLLGEHNEQVLIEVLSYSQEKIKELYKKNAF